MAEPPPPLPPPTMISSCYIPEDLVLDILARLPVKSLLRFRRVCKSWNSIISSPYIFATHHKYGPRRGYYILYQITISEEAPACTVVCDRTFERVSPIQLPFFMSCGRIEGSCNGALLFVGIECGCLSLLNPSIGRFKVLAPPHCLASGHDSATFGFAYDSEENDFKIVRISYTEFTTKLPQAQVYTLSSNSWRRIDEPIPLRPPGSDLIYRIGCNHLPCPFIGGAFHWIVRSKGSDDPEYARPNKYILSFDLRDEKFGEIALPTSDYFNYDGWEDLGLFDGKLASFSFANCKCVIWVMTDYGKAESWTRFRGVEFEPADFVNFRGCTDGGAIVIARMHQEICSIDFIEIEEASNQYRERIVIDIGNRFLTYAAPFVESLALLDGESVRRI